MLGRIGGHWPLFAIEVAFKKRSMMLHRQEIVTRVKHLLQYKTKAADPLKQTPTIPDKRHLCLARRA